MTNMILAGKSADAREIEAVLNDAGLTCVRADTPEALGTFPDNIPVLLLSESGLDPFLLNNSYAAKAIGNLSAQAPLVFLLDRGRDSPDYIYKTAMSRACEAAASKRTAYVLAKSVRSGLPGAEKLYADARSAGVTFIKYERADARPNGDSYAVDVDDGQMNMTIDTPLLVDCSISENNDWTGYAKALRLHTYGNSRIRADRWFLFPGRTSRRGVFFIDTGLILSGMLRETVRSIAGEILRLSSDTPHLCAFIQPQKCAFCYTCYRICPHGALEPDTCAAAMKVIGPLCDGCGMCAAVCPANAIEMRATEENAVNEEFADKNYGAQMTAFCCENSAAIAADTVLRGMDVRIVRIPCGGNLKASQIADALKESDRVLVAVCAEEACRHYDGTKRACLQAEKISRSLERLGLDPHRVDWIQVSHAMPAVLKDAAESLLLNGGKYI